VGIVRGRDRTVSRISSVPLRKKVKRCRQRKGQLLSLALHLCSSLASLASWAPDGRRDSSSNMGNLKDTYDSQVQASFLSVSTSHVLCRYVSSHARPHASSHAEQVD